MKKLLSLAMLFFAVSLSAAVSRIDNQLLPDGNPVLVPGVRQYEKQTGKFEFPDELTLSVPESEKLIIELLQKQFARFAVTVKPAQKAVCRFILDKSVQYGREAGMKRQSYTIEITSSGIEVRASGGAGLFYGARTLGNLLANTANRALDCCKITDWPEFDRRGIFFTVEHVTKDFPKLLKLIDFYSEMKINWLLITFSEKFPSKLPLNPKKNANGWTMEKVIKLKEFCQERHVEITPALQVLSHAKWMTGHPHWQEMSEGKPNKPWNSQPCALNEEAWEITRQYMQEQIDVFKPQTFFVMLDEIFHGPFGQCPKCRAYPDKVALYYNWVRRCEDFLKAQGIETMVCQDSFVDQAYKNWLVGEKLRAKLDKKDLICFWNYNDNLRQDQIKIFRDFPLAGHSVFGKPLNTCNMAQAVRRCGGKDMTIVYWYFSGGLQYNTNYETPDSWGGLVNSADYLWGLPERHYSDFPYDGTYEMVRRFTPEKAVPAAVKEFQPVPLNGSMNAELSGSGKFPVLDEKMTEELKREAAKLPEKFHLVTAPGGRYYGMRLSGKRAISPQDGRNGIYSPAFGNRKIERLAFLFSCSRPDNFLDYQSARVYGKKRYKYEPALRLQLNYADGSKYTKLLRFRQDFNDWNRPFGGFNMRWVLRGRDVNDAYYSFGVFDLINPHPEKPLKGFTMGSLFLDGVSPVLLALSASGCDGTPFRIPAVFNPDKISNPYMEKSKASCEPRIICDFEKDMGAYRVDNPGNMKCKIERVTDETKPGKGKTVLKLTFSPDNRPGLRLNLIARQRFEQVPWGLAMRCRMDNPDALNRIMSYLVDDKEHDYRSYRSSPGTKWRWLCNNINDPNENYMPDLSVIKVTKISFFFADLSKGCVIYLDDVGVIDSWRDLNPRWGIDSDAEPL